MTRRCLPRGRWVGGGDAHPAGNEAVTYSRDVAPILRSQCVSCHREGGAGPFALDSYEAAAAHAAQIKTATTNRVMPPWNIDNSGECQTFADARWLSDNEIATIAKWADSDAPEGKPVKATVSQVEPQALLGQINTQTVVDPSVLSLSSEQDAYRCFALHPGLDHDQYETGFDVLPTTTAIHHVIAYSVDPSQAVGVVDGKPVNNADVMAYLDGQDELPGWDCFGGPGTGVINTGLPAAWVPGGQPQLFPKGTGLPIRKSDVVVLQVHYHKHDDDIITEPAQISLQLQLVDQVERPAAIFLLDGFLDTLASPSGPAQLQAGEASVKFNWKLKVGDGRPALEAYFGKSPASYELLGVFPHMHQLGRKQTFTLDSPSNQVCAANVDRWNYNWQQFFFLNKAIPFNDDTTIDVTCDFDTSSRTEPVLPGFTANDEMCKMGIFMVPVY